MWRVGGEDLKVSIKLINVKGNPFAKKSVYKFVGSHSVDAFSCVFLTIIKFIEHF